MKIFVFFGAVSAILLATFCFVGARGGSTGGGHVGGGSAGGGHAGGGHAGGGHTGGGHISGGHSTAAHAARQTHPQVYHEPSAGIPAVSHPAVRRTPNSQTWRSATIQHVQSGTQARIRQFVQNHTVAKGTVTRGTAARGTAARGVARGAVMPHHDQVTRVQNAFRGYHSNYQRWFDKGFYERHNLRKAYNNWYGNYWYAPTWGVVSDWFPWGWSSPYYYDYPTDGSSSDYSDGDEDQEGDGYSEYVQMAPEQPQPQPNAPSLSPEGQMLPFGVFSVASNVDQAAYSNTVVQLSADKSGQIFGTYYNAAADTTLPITGQIDSQTQQASWAISGQSDSPVMITSTYNLTQDVVPVKMFFEDGSEQNWFYVRMTR